MLSVFFSSFISCKNKEQSNEMTFKKYNFDLQGHRGARGILPENTLPAFQKAIDIGVNTLELDVVISRDSMVVVSHEAYMNPKVCLDADGHKILDKTAFNLFEMNYELIKTFDCGSLLHPDFPQQQQVKSFKPLLSDVIQLLTNNSKEKDNEVALNIELKSSPETDDIYHPKPKVFIDLVMNIIKEESIPLHNITLQSFDKRIVKQISKDYPDISVAYLVERGNLNDNLKKLGLTPQIYSPYYKNIDSLQIRQAHNEGIKIIPWTVNDMEVMQKLLRMGVDGIITDYPNLAKAYHINEMK